MASGWRPAPIQELHVLRGALPRRQPSEAKSNDGGTSRRHAAMLALERNGEGGEIRRGMVGLLVEEK